MTDRPRTVVDCVRFLADDAATTLLDRALQQRWLALDDLTRTCQERLGRRGTRRLVRLVAAMVGGERSAAERPLTANLRRHRIGGWVANLEVRDETGLLAIADVAFPARRLIVEIDGWAVHTSPGACQRDRERQNRLVAAGWTVLRFTWRDLSERPDYVIAVIRRLLDRR
jgi:very-short-patch-repair endonuclease